jgi:hypothetical protein
LKIWSDDNPKAALMERKRAAIVAAARQAFLENGYAQASMDRIAETIFAICSRQSNSRFIALSPGMLIVFLNLAAATRKKS